MISLILMLAAACHLNPAAAPFSLYKLAITAVRPLG
jgi:hypothetical protein